MPIYSTAVIGRVAVDSGQILITDPGYIESWGNEGFGEGHIGHYSYGGACATTLANPKRPDGQLNFPAGHAGIGVVSSAGLGDGYYNVIAHFVELDDWGKRVAKLEIDFLDDEDLENE